MTFHSQAYERQHTVERLFISSESQRSLCPKRYVSRVVSCVSGYQLSLQDPPLESILSQSPGRSNTQAHGPVIFYYRYKFTKSVRDSTVSQEIP